MKERFEKKCWIIPQLSLEKTDLCGLSKAFSQIINKHTSFLRREKYVEKITRLLAWRSFQMSRKTFFQHVMTCFYTNSTLFGWRIIKIIGMDWKRSDLNTWEQFFQQQRCPWDVIVDAGIDFLRGMHSAPKSERSVGNYRFAVLLNKENKAELWNFCYCPLHPHQLNCFNNSCSIIRFRPE